MLSADQRLGFGEKGKSKRLFFEYIYRDRSNSLLVRKSKKEREKDNLKPGRFFLGDFLFKLLKFF